jgi:hypothetical protein
MLTTQQENDLVEIIAEDFGNDLDRDGFIDRCLQMFEDIAGFECLDDMRIQSITTRLWRIYDKH